MFYPIISNFLGYPTNKNNWEEKKKCRENYFSLKKKEIIVFIHNVLYIAHRSSFSVYPAT